MSKKHSAAFDEAEVLAREILDLCHLQPAPVVLAALSACVHHIAEHAIDGIELAPGYTNARTIQACINVGYGVSAERLHGSRQTIVIDPDEIAKA